jgi:hypothetical protein
MSSQDYIIMKRILFTTALVFVACAWSDRAWAQQIVRVSVASDGTQANGRSQGAVFSGDGRFVAFSSAADNLVAGDTNGAADVFIRDLAGHTTTRASVGTDGTGHAGDSGLQAPPAGNARMFSPNVSLSHDGAIVAFSSTAPLDPADTNSCAGHNCSDIYVRDRVLNQTTRISMAADGGLSNDESGDPQVSADGRYVIFTSLASNLVAGDGNGVEDVFLRDRLTQTTTRLSVSPTGTELAAPSYGGRLSANGRIVAFISEAPIVGDPDPVSCEPMATTCGRAFVLDLSSHALTRLPMPATSPGFPLGATVVALDLTPDGRFVAIEMRYATSIGPTGFNSQMLVYDRQTRDLVTSLNISGEHLVGIAINSSGRFVSIGGGFARLFEIGGATFDRQLSDYVQTPDLPNPDYLRATFPALRYTADGLRSVFSTPSPHGADDTNGVEDVYLLLHDADNDGLPDAFETQYGLNPNDPADAALDSDGDEVSNLQEYFNGTNPKGTFKRYFAEGAANSFFSTRFALFNPGDQATTVVMEFLGSNGQFRSTTVPLAAHAWNAVLLDDTTTLQPGNDFSTVIEADHPVVVDRTMTWDKTGYGSHAETAIEAPATTWYLAEGSTGGSFDLFYLLQNPGDAAATVTVNYLRPTPAAPIVKTYTVAPKSRRTVYVDQEGAELAATDVSAKVTSDQPILVERAMYFSTPTQPFAAGHEGAAVSAPATSWFLAEGATGSFFDLFLLLANPDTTDAQVQVTYLLAAGAPIVKTYPVAAQSRLTINVDFEDTRLLDTPVSMVVESKNSVAVIAERAMWWPSANWYEAHLSAGATTTGTKWALAEGEATNTAGSETETYVLIANTSATAGTADVTLFFGDGTSKAKTFDLPANSRVSVPISVEFPTAVGKGGFGTIIQSSGPQIVVERAMYTNANGQTWAAGTDALGTKLQ